ncbi:IpaC/SipC family type III secretion system effector [Escherichia coli]|uniref:IpaC/SipC family type III secretion system effector n=1 Tax=Escherichia coli TaxID=562 RepID=UPI000E2178F5|nr:IpaC/SipC family type III secretion system effector [Escherichia coli]
MNTINSGNMKVSQSDSLRQENIAKTLATNVIKNTKVMSGLGLKTVNIGDATLVSPSLTNYSLNKENSLSVLNQLRDFGLQKTSFTDKACSVVFNAANKLNTNDADGNDDFFDISHISPQGVDLLTAAIILSNALYRSEIELSSNLSVISFEHAQTAADKIKEEGSDALWGAIGQAGMALGAAGAGTLMQVGSSVKERGVYSEAKKTSTPETPVVTPTVTSTSTTPAAIPTATSVSVTPSGSVAGEVPMSAGSESASVGTSKSLTSKTEVNIESNVSVEKDPSTVSVQGSQNAETPVVTPTVTSTSTTPSGSVAREIPMSAGSESASVGTSKSLTSKTEVNIESSVSVEKDSSTVSVQGSQNAETATEATDVAASSEQERTVAEQATKEQSGKVSSEESKTQTNVTKEQENELVLSSEQQKRLKSAQSLNFIGSFVSQIGTFGGTVAMQFGQMNVRVDQASSQIEQAQSQATNVAADNLRNVSSSVLNLIQEMLKTMDSLCQSKLSNMTVFSSHI